MADHATHKVLRVFLASPSDLADERRIAREVVNKVNRVFRTCDLHIELLVWEDTLPGPTRPQEIINRDVDSCHLFVALLWKQWGQPTGEYSSGFEEEFERASERYKATGSPDIWLFFREIERSQLEDPGPELKKVLKFKKDLEKSKRVSFKKFNSSEDWQRKFEEYLQQYTIKLVIASTSTTKIPQTAMLPPQATPTSAAPLPLEKGMSKHSTQRQLSERIRSLNEAISSGNIDFSAKDVKEFDAFDLARLYLLASTLMREYDSTLLLRGHEINLLYQYRDELEVAEAERTLLLATLIDDDNAILSGWYWFKDFDATTLKHNLVYFATNDRSAYLRKRAIEILGFAYIRPAPYLPYVTGHLKHFLTDESELVRQAGIEYLGRVGTMEDIPLLENAVNNENQELHNRAEYNRFLIIVRNDINRAFSELLNVSKIATHRRIDELSENRSYIEKLLFTKGADWKDASRAHSIAQEIKKHSKDIHKDILSEALKDQDGSIRTFAVKELAQRGQLSEKLATSLLRDPSPGVKGTCYRELIIRGKKFNPHKIEETLHEAPPDPSHPLSYGLDAGFVDVDSVILSQYLTFTPDKLLKELDWNLGCGLIAYRALALKHFPTVSARIRADLDDRFKKLKQEHTKKHTNVSVEHLNFSISRKQEEEDILESFISAALAGLVKHGEAQDVEIARRYLSSSDCLVQLEALRVIERLGDDSDTDNLISIAKDEIFELKTAAAKAAIKLSPGLDGAVSSFLMSNDTELFALAVKTILDESLTLVKSVLEPLLADKDSIKRIITLAYFVKKCSEEEFDGLLSRYMERPSYYYDVVCWLDRALYAPPPLKEMFIKKLEAKLE